jgi:hypothetical protein
MRSFGGARSRATGLLAAALLLLSSAAFAVPDVKGVVTGGITPCSGIPIPSSPHYAAGRVTVLKGHVTWKSTDRGYVQDILPATVVAQQSVDANTTYRFVLEPGAYVLKASLQADYSPYVSVTVQPSDDVYVDIPNMCI